MAAGLRAFASVLVIGQAAWAQTTYVTPNYGGGYTVTTPGSGQPPTYVNPNYGGGYTVTTPGSGQPPTYVNPNYGGGYTITTPGSRSNFNSLGGGSSSGRFDRF